jgi:hypothetical protein
MKNIFIALSTLIFCFLPFACNHSSPLPKGEISIPDVRNGKEPEENLVSHKSYDVEVYRTFFMGNAYTVRYYQKENDTLKSHTATYAAVDDFDKAAYSWLNDTSVSIRLYNTVSNKEKKFKVFGYGGMSGMEVDK